MKIGSLTIPRPRKAAEMETLRRHLVSSTSTSELRRRLAA